MKHISFSAKRLFQWVTAGMIFSMIVITISFFLVTKQREILFAGGALLLCALIWLFVLAQIFGKQLALFTSDLCQTLDHMIAGNEEPNRPKDSETQLARISHRLLRLYQIMQDNQRKVDEERQELQSLVSDISHQVKTPVSNLKMVTDTLLTRPVSDIERTDFIRGIRSQTDKLDFLFQALVKTSRLETGVIRLEKKSCNAATVSPHPLIFIAAAIFAWITVQISTRKPARIAARVSPIEAIRYTDSSTNIGRKKKRRSHFGNPARGMAWANLGRNKRRTTLVILSLSVSIILTNMVFTFSHSVDPAKAIKNMIDSDFCIGQSKLFDDYNVSEESALSESYLLAVQQQEGFEIGGAEYGCKALYKSETSKQTFNQQEDGSFSTHIYGLDSFPLSQLQLVDGELDAEKLVSGEYILEGAYVSTRGVLDEGSLNHSVGDRVELECGGSVREFTVLGHVMANEANTYDWVGSCFFLPSDVYKAFTGNNYAMSYKFNVADETELDVDTFLKDYTTNIEPTMTYKSKSTIMAGVSDIQNTIVAVGGTLSFIIGFIGVLNFANTILTSIFTRRRELAILQSIGMTNKQIRTMLCMEGCNYTFISGIVSLPICFIVAYMLIRPICENIWFLAFKMNLWPLLTILPLLFLIGLLIPYFTCRIITGQSVVERLKCGE